MTTSSITEAEKKRKEELKKERDYVLECNKFMRERGDEQIQKSHEDHKGKFTEERDKAKEKEEEWKKKYNKYHFREVEKQHKKIKQKKMKKIKEALAIKYAPFDK